MQRLPKWNALDYISQIVLGILIKQLYNSDILYRYITLTLPVHNICWILPGTSSFLNLLGREAHRCGICKSPNTSTNIMEVDCVVWFSFDSQLEAVILDCFISSGKKIYIIVGVSFARLRHKSAYKHSSLLYSNKG